MQGVEVARVVLQQERCRPQLSCLMTLLQVFCMCFRILNVDLHRLTPAIRHSGQVRVKRGPKRFDRLGERIRPILVFAAAESVPRHHDATAEMLIVIVKR